MNEEKKGVPPWAYLLGGVVVGAAVGILFAPKKGSELREDIKDWSKARAEKGQAFLARMKKEAPAAIEHAKERAQEALAAIKEKAHLSKT
jgi:gas vesicle protein